MGAAVNAEHVPPLPRCAEVTGDANSNHASPSVLGRTVVLMGVAEYADLALLVMRVTTDRASFSLIYARAALKSRSSACLTGSQTQSAPFFVEAKRIYVVMIFATRIKSGFGVALISKTQHQTRRTHSRTASTSLACTTFKMK